MTKGTLAVTGDADADDLLNTDALALLIGMLLDQQVPMEWAFRGPSTLRDRLGTLDVDTIADMDPEEFGEICRAKPAIHRFPAAMATRIQALCQHIRDHYDSDASAIWTDGASADELASRLRALPGYGDEKVKIFMAILAKRMQHRPDGWERHAGPFADPTPRSVADVDSADSLTRVREWKKAQKAKGKSKQD